MPKTPNFRKPQTKSMDYTKNPVSESNDKRRGVKSAARALEQKLSALGVRTCNYHKLQLTLCRESRTQSRGSPVVATDFAPRRAAIIKLRVAPDSMQNRGATPRVSRVI